MEQVRELDLGNAVVTDPQGSEIAVGNDLGDKGARILATAPTLEGLRMLNLRCNRITEQGALALALSPHLQGLQGLDLRFNSIADPDRTLVRQLLGRRAQL